MVLALFLKLFIDPKAGIESRPHPNDGRPGFWITATRAITQAELEEVMKDTKSWKSEQEQYPGRVRYPESDTADLRREKGGISR